MIVVLSGCVTRKSAVKEDTKLDKTENVEKKESISEEQNSRKEESRAVKTNVTDKSITRTIETVLSAPDSLGRQYPEKTLETETRNDVTTENQQHEQIITDLQSKNERLTSEVAELTKKLDQAKSSKTQTTTKVPIWTYIVVLLTGSALALLIRRWLKRKFNL